MIKSGKTIFGITEKMKNFAFCNLIRNTDFLKNNYCFIKGKKNEGFLQKFHIILKEKKKKKPRGLKAAHMLSIHKPRN